MRNGDLNGHAVNGAYGLASPETRMAAATAFVSWLGREDASESLVKKFIENDKHPLFEAMRGHFVADRPEKRWPEEIEAGLEDWRRFYAVLFGMKVDLTKTVIPARKFDMDRMILVPKGIRLDAAVEAYEERRIPVHGHKKGSLERLMRPTERGKVVRSYVIWVRDSQEPDEPIGRPALCAEAVRKLKLPSESLLERLLHGLKSYDYTHIHLDAEASTLCAHSRFANGMVPCVDRYSGGIGVWPWKADRPYDRIRIRKAIRFVPSRAREFPLLKPQA